MLEAIIDENVQKMENVIKNVQKEISKLKTDLAHPSILSEVNVEYYGSKLPISQVSKITVVDGKQLFIKPYEKNLLANIESAIKKENMGLNPQNNGDNLIITIPQLTEDKRKQIIKKLHNISEMHRVMIRNIRRGTNQLIKKDTSLSKNQQQNLEEKIQKITDKKIKEINEISLKKEKQILTV